MPPTPRWTKLSLTSSRSSLRRLSVMASSVPWTSAFKMRFSVADSPRWICSKRSSSLAPGAVGDGAWPATRKRRSRASPMVRAVAWSEVTRNSSPAAGGSEKPRTCDRRRRQRLFDLVAVVVDERLDLAPGRTGHDRVADPQRAALDDDRRHRAAADSRLASSTVAAGGPSGLAWSSCDLGHDDQLLEQVVDAEALRAPRPRP